MKKDISKSEASEQINKFFERKRFSSEEARKIKKLAMKFRIKLKEHKKGFCRKCFSQLAGKIRIRNGIKSVECASCSCVNRWKI
ncbi:MAG: hypothetical protein AABX11_04235 [Nanoarchaeota archaeon]